MTPQKQLFRHRPAEGIYGDCYRTAVACLLDLPVEEVPHAHENFETGREFPLHPWLQERGLMLAFAAYPAAQLSMGEILRYASNLYPGVNFMFSGASANGCGHVVIARDGEIVWDPSLDDSGIVGLVFAAYCAGRAVGFARGRLAAIEDITGEKRMSSEEITRRFGA